MGIFGRLDFWAMVFILGLMAWIGWQDYAKPALVWLVGQFITIRPAADSARVGARSLLLALVRPFIIVRPAPEREANSSHDVRGSSAHLNAENERSERSALNAQTLMLPDDLPANVGELQQLAHAIVLYARRPNKELAILGATGLTKGGGPEYTRFSRLFDVAISREARQVAKAKPQPVREVETA
jgi:hypothetical protein